MSLDQLKAFLGRMQSEAALRQAVMAAATADDVAQIAGTLGYEFSGDEPLRLSGQKVGRVTVSKQEIKSPLPLQRGPPGINATAAPWSAADCRPGTGEAMGTHCLLRPTNHLKLAKRNKD